MSPVAHIAEKVAPALLMLGAKDRRVPPSQGRRWAELVGATGSRVQTLVFPDAGHALDTFEAERVGFDAAASFFLELMK